MDITDKLKKIGVFLAEKGFVPILKKMTGAIVPAVKLLSVTRKQPSHEGCEGNITASEKQMNMIFHQCPGITGCGGLPQKEGQTGNEIFIVL
jgi:hypothetical protein